MKFRIAAILFFFVASTVAFAQESKEPYQPCVLGPTTLRQVDKWEAEKVVPNLTDASGKLVAPEIIAEKFISDCSEKLSSFVMVAESTDSKPAQGIAAAWKVNLEFMQWWLQNRRAKGRATQAK